jgi:hypothetical protein
MRKILTLFLILTSWGLKSDAAPKKILDNPAVMQTVDSAVRHLYNFDFETADSLISAITGETPGHPVGPFLEGLSFYWRNYPLLPGQGKTETYIALMDSSIERAGKLLEVDKNDVEGTFFDLVGRAMLLLYYADNGVTSGYFKNILPAYHDVMKGFDMMNQFNEFYFTTGLYNYYREAYPEAHPVYKAATMFLKSGDEARGLKQLEYAADHCVFLKVEANLYLSYIYLNYENNPAMAAERMRRLHKRYPDNTYFLCRYGETLLINKQFDKAKLLLSEITKAGRKDDYVKMKGLILSGFFNEKTRRNFFIARHNYLAGLKLSKDFGEIAENFQAIAYWGLYRIYKQQNQEAKASHYKDLAREHSSYDYLSGS